MTLPVDLKSDEEKKKFFNYVDKNYKGEKDEEVEKLQKNFLNLKKVKCLILHQLMKDGKSAEEIAKIMEVDVKTIKKPATGHERYGRVL